MDEIKIIINMTGGVIQGVSTNTNQSVDILIVDYDPEDYNEEALIEIPQPHSGNSKALIQRSFGPILEPVWVNKVFKLLNK